MAKLLTFPGEMFEWNGRVGVSNSTKLRLNRFPATGFYIRSHRTGETQLFLPDNETNEANEFFDGEAVAYFAPGANIKVQIWV